MPLIQVLFLVLMTALIGCSGNVTPPQEQDVSAEQALEFEKQCADGQCPCPTPLGTIKHGTEVTIYEQDQAGCKEDCADFASQARCENGELLTETENFSYVCKVEACRSCTIGINKLLHGENTLLFSQPTVGCFEDCSAVKGEVKCDDGQLIGAETFIYSTCQRQLCHCQYPDNTQYMSIGGSKRFYEDGSPACGSKCGDPNNSAVRTCVEANPGVFNFDSLAKFDKSTCVDPTGCSCVLPGGVNTIPDGAETFLTKTLLIDDCEATCPADETALVKCQNGDLINKSDNNSVIDIQTTEYKFEGQCKVRPCDNCDGFAHDTPKRFYRKASPNCSEQNLCDQSNSVVKTCKDGTWLPARPNYPSLNCYTRACSCDDPINGRFDIAVGATADFYPSKQLQCGTSCPTALKELRCTESVVSGQTEDDGTTPIYEYKFEDPSSPFPPGIVATDYTSDACNPSKGCDCELPNGLGVVADKTRVVLHKSDPAYSLVQDENGVENIIRPSCATPCSETDQIEARCDSGTLRNSFTDAALDVLAPNFEHRYSCENSTCEDCELLGYGNIPANVELILYPKDKLECGDDRLLLQAKFTCYGGVLRKNGNVVASDAEPGVSWFQEPEDDCTGCKAPWDVEYPFGQEVTFYMISGSGNVVNECGQGCKSAVRKCLDDGTWEGDDQYFVDFTLQACPNDCSDEGGGAPPRVCLLPWQNSYVTPDSVVPMWKKKTVGCGESCQDHFKLGRCEMSTGTFDAGFEYIYPSCTQVCN